MSWGEDVCATERNEEIWWIRTGRNANEVLRGEANRRKSWLEWSGQLCVRALSRKSSPSRGEASPNSNGLDWLAVCPFALCPLPSGPVPPEAGLASWAGIMGSIGGRKI